jgi:hypothetical protein
MITVCHVILTNSDRTKSLGADTLNGPIGWVDHVHGWMFDSEDEAGACALVNGITEDELATAWYTYVSRRNGMLLG